MYSCQWTVLLSSSWCHLLAWEGRVEATSCGAAKQLLWRHDVRRKQADWSPLFLSPGEFWSRIRQFRKHHLGVKTVCLLWWTLLNKICNKIEKYFHISWPVDTVSCREKQSRHRVQHCPGSSGHPWSVSLQCWPDQSSDNTRSVNIVIVEENNSTKIISRYNLY